MLHSTLATKRVAYIRTQVRVSSLDELQEQSWAEPSTPDSFTLGLAGSTDLYKALTKRQRKIARELANGYSRKEVAAKNGISVQAIHQMVPRMRTRLRAYMDGSHESR